MHRCNTHEDIIIIIEPKKDECKSNALISELIRRKSITEAKPRRKLRNKEPMQGENLLSQPLKSNCLAKCLVRSGEAGLVKNGCRNWSPIWRSVDLMSHPGETQINQILLLTLYCLKNWFFRLHAQPASLAPLFNNRKFFSLIHKPQPHTYA